MSQVAPVEIPAFVHLWKSCCRMLLLFSEVVQKKFKHLNLNNLRLAFVHPSVSAQKLNQRELNLYLNTLPNWIMMKVTEQATFLKRCTALAWLWICSHRLHWPQTWHVHECQQAQGSCCSQRLSGRPCFTMAKAGLMDASVLRVFSY